MKKYVYATLLAAMVLLTGCSSVKKAAASTIYIDKNGKVTSVLVESFTAESYDQTELEEYIRNAINEFNDGSSKKTVSLDSYTVKQGQIRAILEYASAADYESFNQTTLFCGTVPGAQAAGYEFNGNFNAAGGDPISGSELLETNPEAHVIILNEPLRVMTEKHILYVSSNVKIVDANLAQVLPDEQEENENAQIMTADYAYIIYE